MQAVAIPAGQIAQAGDMDKVNIILMAGRFIWWFNRKHLHGAGSGYTADATPCSTANHYAASASNSYPNTHTNPGTNTNQSANPNAYNCPHEKKQPCEGEHTCTETTWVF
jgi:hypothetical protein